MSMSRVGRSGRVESSTCTYLRSYLHVNHSAEIAGKALMRKANKSEVAMMRADDESSQHPGQILS